MGLIAFLCVFLKQFSNAIELRPVLQPGQHGPYIRPCLHMVKCLGKQHESKKILLKIFVKRVVINYQKGRD